MHKNRAHFSNTLRTKGEIPIDKQNPVKQVETQRTPEEWAEILKKAKGRSDLFSPEVK